MELYRNLEVPPAWLVDNCSNEIHYTVEVEDGTVIGNDESGYVVTGLPRGIQNAYIVAEDCCEQYHEEDREIECIGQCTMDYRCISGIQ
ncbi:MAG: hypothetical protein IPM86_02915 [Saprospiraceae bacterium]|nr:hypothetical protein [Saprospiraceae bacterium]